MSKRLSARNPKSRGFKTKYVIQICLLLGVCCWLIYQIKHSHEKKKEFDENGMREKLSGDDNMFFGRKGLIRDVPKIDNHGEDEEVDEDSGDASDREDIKMEQEKEEAEMRHREEENRRREQSEHEDEEGREEESKSDEEAEQEEKEEEVVERGTEEEKNDEDVDEKHDDTEEHVGDDVDGQEDHDGEVKEEKTSDQNDIDGDDDRIETEILREDHEGDGDKDLDGGDDESHEAREENYKADDASSAVAHDSQAVITESENVNLGNGGEGVEDKEVIQQEFNSTDTSHRVLVSNESMELNSAVTSMISSDDQNSDPTGNVTHTFQSQDVTSNNSSAEDTAKAHSIQEETASNTEQLNQSSNSSDIVAHGISNNSSSFDSDISSTNEESTESEATEKNPDETIETGAEDEATNNEDEFRDSTFTQSDRESAVELGTLPDISANGVNDRNAAIE